MESSQLAVFLHGLQFQPLVPAFSSRLGFPQQWTVMQTCKPGKTFAPKVAFGFSVYHSNRKPTKTAA